jgi:flagellar hook-basal body complex protein FliE
MIIPAVAFLDRLASADFAGQDALAAKAPAIGQTTFADAVADVADRTIGKLRSAEEMSLAALKGEADTREVVDAVMSAEQTLQTAIAIRDKIVTAYLEVSRMAI